MSELFGGVHFRTNILLQCLEIGPLEAWWWYDADSQHEKRSLWLDFTVHSKCKTIIQRFHDNSRWLVAENSIYSEGSSISDNEKTPKGRASVLGLPNNPDA